MLSGYKILWSVIKYLVYQKLSISSTVESGIGISFASISYYITNVNKKTNWNFCVQLKFIIEDHRHVYLCIRSSIYIFACAKGFYITAMSCSWKWRLKNQSLKPVQTGESSHQLLSCFHQFYGIRAGPKHNELSLPRCLATRITGMFFTSDCPVKHFALRNNTK